MYDDLVKRLREIHPEEFDDAWDFAFACQQAMCEAADALEELSKDLDSLNEANIALYGALPRWISVEEALPEEADGAVLVYLPYGLAHDRVKTARYSQFSGKWYIGDFCAVSREKPIAWTWLPEPPEEETVHKL